MASPKTLTIQYMLLFSHLSVQLPVEQERVRERCDERRIKVNTVTFSECSTLVVTCH